jgi:predicted acetyltransferase
MPSLTTPTTDLHRSWLEHYEDWGRGAHLDGGGLHDDDDVDSPEGFARWVTRLRVASDRSVPTAPGLVHCSYWWITEGDTVQGSIALRHELNDFLLDAGGHIGYGVRPSARRRGLASWALREVLGEARKLGIDRALVTCDVTNEASRRTIEGAGGVREDERDTSLGRLYRYWISL